MAGIVESLQAFRKCLSKRENVSVAVGCVCNLTNYFEEELSNSEIDTALVALFEKENGIISTIKKALPLKTYKNAVVEALCLLKYLLFHHREYMSPFVESVKDLCVTCISRTDTSVSEKEKAYECLHELVGSGSWNQNLNMDDLINKILLELEQTKSPPKVRQKLLHILGTISRFYPEHMTQHGDKLLRFYFYELEKQGQSRDVSSAIVAGCLEGLADYMCTFSQFMDNSVQNQKVYAYIKTYTSFQSDRKIIQRAALKVLELHGILLKQHLYEDYLWWHQKLISNWLSAYNSEDKMSGRNSLLTFYEVISASIQESSNNEQENAKGVLKYFIDYFKEKLLSASVEEKAHIIQGLGKFSQSCLKFMSEENVQSLLSLLMHQAQQLYMDLPLEHVNETSQKRLQTLPYYVESISSIIMHLKCTEIEVPTLQHMTIVLIHMYGVTPSKFQPPVVHALLSLMYSLASIQGLLFDDFINIVVYQSLIRSCASSEHERYVPLWRVMTDAHHFGNYDVSCGIKQRAINKIYDTMIKTVIEIVKKLDLKVFHKVDNCLNTQDDPNLGLEARNPHDFKIFIHLVEFYLAWIFQTDFQMFRKWVEPYMLCMIIELGKNPLVSGFYKLLATCFKICEKISYFDDFEYNIHDRNQSLCQMICKCLQHLPANVKNFKGDLQIACVNLFLETPHVFLHEILPNAIEMFNIAFRVGRTYLKLASEALDALEKWKRYISNEDMNPVLQAVLPELEYFLRNRGADIGIDKELQFLQSRRQSRKRYSLTRKKLVEIPDSELLQLQKHILSFLGPLDFNITLSLLDSQQESVMSWGQPKKLKLKMPFKNTSISIYIDSLLPRVVDLAVNCSDRQTRVAACELLHAVIVFMLGTNKQMASSDSTEMSEVFEKIFLPLLQLGCDSDEVVYQLFNPLVYQLAHWYSSPYQLQSKNSETFVNTLLDGVAHPSDSSLRDISAKCLREFVEWSIKQHTSRRLEKSSVNIEMIITRICMLCGHPNASKRLGGALAFNSVYKVLREDESIIDQWFLELLFFLVKNLALLKDSATIGVITETEQAVEHVFRVLRERAHVFNKNSKQRRKPSEFGGIMLYDAVVWLLHQCRNENRSCRFKCMEMVCVLAPLIKSFESFDSFINKFVEKENFLGIIEGSANKSCSLSLAVSKIELEKSPSHVMIWLHSLDSALHCHVWLFKNWSKHHLLLTDPNSNIIHSIENFIMLNDQEELNLYNFMRQNTVTDSDNDLFLQVKSTVILNIFDFLSAILTSQNENLIQLISQKLFSSSVWRVISKCLFNSSAFGFELRDDEAIVELHNSLKIFLHHLQTKYKSSHLLLELGEIVGINFKNLITKFKQEIKLMLINGEYPQNLKPAILGMIIVQESDLSILTEEEADNFHNFLLQVCFEAVVHVSQNVNTAVVLKPSAQSLGELLLKFACVSEKQIPLLVRLLLDSTILSVERTGSLLQHGEHFQSTFKKNTLMPLLCFPEASLKALVERLDNNDSIHRALSLIDQLCLFALENRKVHGKLCQILHLCVLQHWEEIEACANKSTENTAFVLVILKHISVCAEKRLGGLAAQPAGKWILTLLSHPSSNSLVSPFQNLALDLLPYLIPSPSSFPDELKDVLQIFCQGFPEFTSELTPGTPQFDGFVSAFSKMLVVLQVTGNLYLLKRIIALSVRDSNHICGKNIQKSLPNFMSCLNCELQCKAIEIGYNIFIDNSEYTPQIRLNCVKFFVVPLIKSSHEEAVIQFFTMHMQKILDILGAAVESTRMIQTEHNLVSNVGCWWMIEALFTCVSSEVLESKTCLITKNLNLGKGLTHDLSGKAYRMRKESLSVNTKENCHLKELFRVMQCAIYSVLVVIVCSTKKELKFFTGLLFKEDEKSTLWDKLVDCTHNYSFPISWEQIPKQRKILVSIRKSTQREVRYLPTETQFLVNSTLAEDVTCFDLTTSIHQPPNYEVKKLQDTCVEVSLEDDILNKHECMGVLCALLRHMAIKNLYVVPTTENPKPEIPSWMEQMRKSMLDSSKHQNIRTFLTKLVLNNVNIFKPFASYWLYPLMQIVVDGCLGYDINYMVMDVIAMLISWHEIAVPNLNESEKLLATEILQFLILNARSQRRDVFKYNLEAIRTLVEVWKNCLAIPHQKLLDLLSVSSKDDTISGETAIHIASIFLANDIQPWNDFGKRAFFSSLTSFISYSSKLLASSSEVVGMCLKHLNPEYQNITEENEGIFTMIKQKICNLEKYTDKYLTCLHSIQRHYALILDNFRRNILYQLSKVNGKFKVMCIEMICARLDVFDESDFTELESKGLLTLLHHGDIDMQHAILQLIKKMLPLVNYNKQQLLVSECVNLSAVRNPTSRLAVFKILMWAFDQKIIFENGIGVLLKGMLDSNSDIQELLFNFWNDEKRLSSVMPNRFLSLISTMYSVETEQYFLSYALHLLLDKSVFTSAYDSKMFEHPLSQCDFKELQVLMSQRRKLTSLVPLFSQFPGSSLLSQQSTVPSELKINATQRTMKFQPTLDVSKDHPESTIGSSLMFTAGSGTLKSFRTVAGSSENDEPDRELSTSFRSRRLLKDVKQVSRMHAFFEARRATRRQLLQEERIKNREVNISLYRTYRTGDFPDIEIPYSSIFKPLQVLTKFNSPIAQQMMILLFSGIMTELKDEELTTFSEAITGSFCAVMQKTQGNPLLIGSIFEMILSCDKQFGLKADIVSSVSQGSGLLILGSLVLEKTLINHSEPGNENTAENSTAEDYWLRLAELYQDMEEEDVVHGVFHEKLNCCLDAKDALKAEAEGHWEDARNYYVDAIKSEDPNNLKDYYFEAFYQCLANLSNWKQLLDCVNEQVDGSWELLWSDAWNKQHLLPQLFASYIQLIGSEDCNLFFRNLKFWLQDQAKTEYMQLHFTEELAALYATSFMQHNFVKARVFANNCYIQFLNDWVNMNAIGFKQRATALRDIHRLSELQIYLDFVSAHSVNKDLNQLESYWKGCTPKAVSSLLDWDRRLAYRSQFIKYVKEKFPSSSSTLERIEMEIQLSMVDSAIVQNNYSVANKYILFSKERLSSLPLYFNLRWTLGFSKCIWLKALQTSKVPDKLCLMIEACSKLLDHDPCKYEEWKEDWLLQLQACELMGKMAKEFWNVLKNNPECLCSLNEKDSNVLWKWLGTKSSKVDTIMNAIHDCGLTYLRTAVNVATVQEKSSTHLSSVVADAYLKIAEYYQATKMNVNGEVDFLVAVLHAMKFGSRGAHYLFPRLLQNTILESEWVEKFITESAGIAEWMFLKWISQILACLDKSIGKALHQIVLRVAEAYPQAMTWPFRISREKYSSNCVPQDVLYKLDSLLLQDNMTEKFLEAMSCLAQPEIILMHHLDRVLKVFKKKVISEDVLRACQDLMNKVQELKLQNRVQGSYFEVLKEYYPQVLKESSLILENKKSGLENLKRIKSELEGKVRRKSAKKVPLQKYSPWLCDFQISPWGDYLELPGQYTGECRPVPQYHVRIAGFLPEIHIIHSLRLPIKLTIIGNNAKEYPYLVKYGEDLRQDQRIQQLFNVMNTVFSKDPGCLHRQINIITYQVIPLTSELGLIQWINDTKTFKSIIEMNLNEEERKNYDKAYDMCRNWLESGCGRSETNYPAMHRIAYRNYSREETVRAYQDRVKLIPWDVLRRAFMHISANQEEFFARRQKFACIYASMCISHWILGIGDRHLENCLVREHDGSCVGIDFGYAFGCGLQFIPVPELMPFRMTPLIINILKPFKSTGIFQGTMVHCLRALRNEYQIILATMEVFVHEPSINWIELAQQKYEDDQRGGDEWLPQEKLFIAKRKLGGANPVAVGSDELRAGHQSSQYLDDYLKVLRGLDTSFRSQANSTDLTPLEQVKCLIELATDPHILGKTYIGWQPWI